MARCLIRNNEASQYGGGLYVKPSSDVTLTLDSCVIADNVSGSLGGGIHQAADGGILRLVNCTVVNNHAYGWGGGLWSEISLYPSAQVIADNSIFWGNTIEDTEGNGLQMAAFRDVLVRFSDVQDGTSGIYVHPDPNFTLDWQPSNLQLDPLFVNALNGDYHLTSGASTSPCIDAGENGLGMALLDGERHPRIVNCTVDMGAYEYAAAPLECPGLEFCPCTDAADIRADLNGDGFIDAGDDALEATTALYFVVNSDDDNGNGLEDYLDDGPVENEDDLVEIRMSAKCPALNCETAWWSISWTEPDPSNPALKIWRMRDKSDGLGGVGTPIANGVQNFSWPPPQAIWLEGAHSFDEIEITLAVTDNTSPTAVAGPGPGVTIARIFAAAPCSPARPRYWVGFKKHSTSGKFSGVEADITTRDVAPLCGEPYASSPAMSAVYVSIGRLEPSWPQTQFSDAWVQLGYRRVRFTEAPGQVIIRTERYVENMKGPDPQADYLYWFSPPPPAGIWNYRIIYIEIANELDCWEFQWDDGVPPPDIPQRTCEPYWDGRKGGNDVVWMGELANREDRLAGLGDSRCVFSLCNYQYDFSGNPDFPNFTQDDEFWGGDGNPGIIHYSLNRLGTSGFEIWDNIP